MEKRKTCICQFCNVTFIPKRRTWQKYCSRICADKQWHKDHPDYHRKWQKENKGKVAVYSKDRTEKNRLQVRKCHAKKRRLVDSVRIHYGCQNPDCPVDRKRIPVYAIDFHHIGEKKFNISIFRHHRFDAIISEINRCICLCNICHRMAHKGDLDVSKIPLCRLDENGDVIL